MGAADFACFLFLLTHTACCNYEDALPYLLLYYYTFCVELWLHYFFFMYTRLYTILRSTWYTRYPIRTWNRLILGTFCWRIHLHLRLVVLMPRPPKICTWAFCAGFRLRYRYRSRFRRIGVFGSVTIIIVIVIVIKVMLSSSCRNVFGFDI